MALLKCKQCGGDVDVVASMPGIGKCQHCGTKQTLPKIDDDTQTTRYNRGNDLRMRSEFDKAAAVYERIVEEDDTAAEAHWCLALCRYGIEYVEDPRSGERVPTCHRASFEIILNDASYLAALQHADDYSGTLYKEEAEKIAKIQQRLLALSRQEEPFDIFICYKETTGGGSRTKDSVLAQDIYDQLVKEGFKVFFSRITLEDKLGTEYEPYIFAALNSAKVMLVVGMSSENFTAVWVKNEWSRYLSLMRIDSKRQLIPCYKDMDAYDLPDDLAMLQAQDMGKLGAMQDLLRGVKKLVGAESRYYATGGRIAPLLDRAFIMLEDNNWSKADSLLEQVLNLDPKNAQAYVGKLMTELKKSAERDLAEHSAPLSGMRDYEKAVRFADDAYKNVLTGYNQAIIDRINREKENVYRQALAAMKTGKDEWDLHGAAQQFKSIEDYKDASELARQSDRMAWEKRDEAAYDEIVTLMNADNSSEVFLKAAERFESICGYRDASELARQCRDVAKQKQDEERSAEKQRQEEERIAEKQRRLDAARKKVDDLKTKCYTLESSLRSKKDRRGKISTELKKFESSWPLLCPLYLVMFIASFAYLSNYTYIDSVPGVIMILSLIFIIFTSMRTSDPDWIQIQFMVVGIFIVFGILAYFVVPFLHSYDKSFVVQRQWLAKGFPFWVTEIVLGGIWIRHRWQYGKGYTEYKLKEDLEWVEAVIVEDTRNIEMLKYALADAEKELEEIRMND